MIYSNFEFLLLFLPTLVLFCAGPAKPWRYGVLMVSSLIFYAWAGVFDFLIFVSVVLASWFATWLAHRSPRYRRLYLSSGIVVLAAHLLVWKYAPWVVGEVQRVFPHFLDGQPLRLALPIGISFFTLQGIAYLLDFQWNRASYIPLGRYALFKSFFPQLVAGPICRTPQLLPQIEKLEGPRGNDLSTGLALFALGFFKKLVIADTVAPLVDRVFASPELFSRGALFGALVGYSLQIWADFSGYTDMGRGCARMMGFHLPENFLSPYLARSPSEFWKRWHITLSEWIRDYIYIPLGRLLPRKAFLGAAMVTMIISGLWHGASWCFLIWGLYHGVLLWLENRLKQTRMHRFFQRFLPAPVFATALWLVMSLLTLLGWLIFRSGSVGSIAVFFGSFIDGGGQDQAWSSVQWVSTVALLTALVQVLGFYDFETKRYPWLELIQNKILTPSVMARPITAILAGLVLALLVTTALGLRSELPAKAFIYFQF